VFIAVWFYRIGKGRRKSVDFRIMMLGLALFLVSGFADYIDDFPALNALPVFGREAPYHDVVEDQIGDTLGFALFALGAGRLLRRR